MNGSAVPTTSDCPAPGLVVVQPRRGFRFGSEAIWLVGFALEGGPIATALELGTGSGVAALLLARLGACAVGVDHRTEWAPLWAESLRQSSVSGQVELRTADIRSAPKGPFDVVLSNPPYFPMGTGPVASDPFRAAARTESTATLAEFVAEASLRAPRSCWVIPAERLAELVAAGAAVGQGPLRVVRVGARRALVELSGEGDRPDEERVGVRGGRTRAWYARAGAYLAPPAAPS